jgi:hypothetical protein
MTSITSIPYNDFTHLYSKASCTCFVAFPVVDTSFIVSFLHKTVQLDLSSYVVYLQLIALQLENTFYEAFVDLTCEHAKSLLSLSNYSTSCLLPFGQRSHHLHL